MLKNTQKLEMQNNCFIKKYQIEENMLDNNGYLKISTIFNIIQDIASIHANEINLDFKRLFSNNHIWMIIRNFIQVKNPIKVEGEITVKTSLTKPNFIECPRETEFIYNGETFISSKTIWMIYDFKNNQVVSPSFYEEVMTDNVGNFGRRIKKMTIRSDENYKNIGNHTVDKNDIDKNNHMNNVKYIELCEKFADVSLKDIKNIQAEYFKQSFLGDNLTISKTNFESKNRYAIKNDKLENVAIMEVEI